MQKNLPIIIFTGFAVAAAGTLGSVLTHEKPWHWVKSPDVAESVAPAPEAKKSEPQIAVAVPPKVEEPIPPQSSDAVAPSFDAVRVEPNGDAVISGHAKPGAEVVVKLAGAEVGRATANGEGSFVLIPEKPLPAGAGALTLESKIDDVIVPSTEQVAVVVKQDQTAAIVAKVTPDQPVAIVTAPETTAPAKTVELSAVDYDADGNIQFQGRVQPNGRVRFYIDNSPVGETLADQNGQWQFKGATPIAVGEHNLRADEVDAAGQVLSRVEQPFMREAAEKIIAQTTVEKTDAPAVVEPQVADVAPVATVQNRIVIQPGQSLWRISREVYGKGRLFTILYEANKDRIKDPSKIYPGQIVEAPNP